MRRSLPLHAVGTCVEGRSLYGMGWPRLVLFLFISERRMRGGLLWFCRLALYYSLDVALRVPAFFKNSYTEKESSSSFVKPLTPV